MAANLQGREPAQIHIGARVTGPDGTEATVRRVVVDPDSGRVLDLIVELGSPAGPRQVVLPMGRVADAGDRGVRTDLTRDGLERLPDFEAVHFRQPPESWPGLPDDTPDAVYFWAPRNAVEAFVPPNIVPEPNVVGVRQVPPGSVTVSADLDVTCGSVVVGHVDRVLVDPDEDRATHLVVRHGLLGTDERVVPVTDVLEVTDQQIELDCRGRDLSDFPPYRG